MNESYLTIKETASSEITIQKSRFIGYALPCESEEDAQLFIRNTREKYRDAKHHCYAYIIGVNSGIMRYSDDGEPGGTAGMPMMDVLKNSGIVNCCVVVVRYFGGILLGTGGLVRAYTQACKAAVEAASVVRMELSVVMECMVAYPFWNQIQFSLQNMPVSIDHVSYTDSVHFNLCARSRDLAAAVVVIDNLTGGKAVWSEPEEKYMPWNT